VVRIEDPRSEVSEAHTADQRAALVSFKEPLALKVGTALGSAVTAYGLAYGGYQPEAVSAHAVHVIRGLYYVPAIAVGALQLLCIQFYPGSPPARVQLHPEVVG